MRGLCLACGGFETESWSRSIVIPRSDPVETLQRRLDRMVDPRLEGDSESEKEFDDVVEQRLASLRSNRDDGMKQRLDRWEKEEAESVLSAE